MTTPRPTQPEDEAHGGVHGILKLHFRVRSYEVGQDGRLSPVSLGHYLQEAASRHAHDLGFGIAELARQGYYWVLTHLALNVIQRPLAASRVVVATWPTPVVRLSAGRQFSVGTDGGRPVAQAASAWMILDKRRRRPVRASQILARIPQRPENPDCPVFSGKLPALESAAHEKALKVRQRDLDVNRHVNNVAYLEWLLESVPANLYHTHELSGLKINYLAESLAGDTILCRCTRQSTAPLEFLHSLARGADGQELVRAQTRWRPRD